MSAVATGLGLKRLQHLVLWVSNVERSVRFYTDVLGFEVKTQYPTAAFLRIPGSADDHHLGASSRRHDPWQCPHEDVIAAQRLEIAGCKGDHLIGACEHAS